MHDIRLPATSTSCSFVMGILLSPLTVTTLKKPSMSVLPSFFSAFADNMTTGRPLTPSTSVLPLSHKPVSAILRPSTLIFAS